MKYMAMSSCCSSPSRPEPYCMKEPVSWNTKPLDPPSSMTSPRKISGSTPGMVRSRSAKVRRKYVRPMTKDDAFMSSLFGEPVAWPPYDPKVHQCAGPGSQDELLCSLPGDSHDAVHDFQDQVVPIGQILRDHSPGYANKLHRFRLLQRVIDVGLELGKVGKDCVRLDHLILEKLKVSEPSGQPAIAGLDRHMNPRLRIAAII